MKKAPVYILLILFLCTAGLYSVEISDAKDTTKVRKKKEVYLVLTGGLGLGWGGHWNYNDYIIQSQPMLSMGFEIPFTRAHKFAFELSLLEWFGKQAKLDKTEETSMYYANHYINLGETTFTDISISQVLKWYVTNESSKFRFSVHLGIMLPNISHLKIEKPHGTCDIGLACYYPLADNLTLSLTQRLFFSDWFHGGTINIEGGGIPNILSLNINYKFKL